MKKSVSITSYAKYTGIVRLLFFVVSVLVSCTQVKKEVPTAITGSSPIDSLTLNDYKLMFYKNDSVAFTDIYDDAEYRKKLTDTIGNWHQRARTIQNYLSEKYNNYFYTTDSSLVLKLANGENKPYPYWDSEKGEGFNFEHFFIDINYYLLRVQWDEGNCWMLVNRKNGFQKYISGLPYISPDNTRILTVNTDLEAGYSFNGFEMYSMGNDSLALEFKKETEWGPAEARWETDSTFLLKREFFKVDTIKQVQSNVFDYTLVKVEKQK